MGDKFNFRGSPLNGEDFYMVAVLKKEYISDFKGATNNNFNGLGEEADKFFFLCQNQYNENSVNYQRLYWSSDPDDLQKNTGEGYLNQGAVKVNVQNIGGVDYLRYRTTITPGSILSEPGQYRNFSNNLEKITGEENSLAVTFSPKSNYNVNQAQIYYSLPYQIKTAISYQFTQMSTATSNNIDWVFRKIQHLENPSPTVGFAIPKPNDTGVATYYPENIFNFVDVTGMNSTSGTATSNFNYGTARYISVSTGVSISASSDFTTSSTTLKVTPQSADVLDLFHNNNFPQKNSNLVLTDVDAGTSTAIYYSKKTINTSDVEFTLSDSTYSRGLLGNDIITTIVAGKSVQLLMNLRNDEECFTSLPDNSEFQSIFDIYFIPSEQFAIFPGGYTIDNNNVFPVCYTEPTTGITSGEILEPVPGDLNLEFYNNISRAPNTGHFSGGDINKYIDCGSITTAESINSDKLNKYKKIFNLFMFQLLGTLSTTTWTKTNMSNYRNIAYYYDNTNTNPYPMTFFTWDVWEEASQAFVFDYCQSGDSCGYCYGLTTGGGNICYADNMTRERAVLTTTSNSLPPLASYERSTGTHSNPGNQTSTALIIVTVILGIFLLVAIILIVRMREESKRGL